MSLSPAPRAARSFAGRAGGRPARHPAADRRARPCATTPPSPRTQARGRLHRVPARLPGSWAMSARQRCRATPHRLPPRHHTRPRTSHSMPSRASTARRSSSIRSSGCSRCAPGAPTRRGRGPRFLTGYAMKGANSTGVQRFRRSGLRLRHRLGRRTGARVCGRGRAGQGHLLLPAGKTRRDAGGATAGIGCFNVESEAEIDVLNDGGARTRPTRQ